MCSPDGLSGEVRLQFLFCSTAGNIGTRHSQQTGGEQTKVRQAGGR
jgi:hypothetical protein